MLVLYARQITVLSCVSYLNDPLPCNLSLKQKHPTVELKDFGHHYFDSYKRYIIRTFYLIMLWRLEGTVKADVLYFVLNCSKPWVYVRTWCERTYSVKIYFITTWIDVLFGPQIQWISLISAGWISFWVNCPFSPAGSSLMLQQFIQSWEHIREKGLMTYTAPHH